MPQQRLSEQMGPARLLNPCAPHGPALHRTGQVLFSTGAGMPQVTSVEAVPSFNAPKLDEHAVGTKGAASALACAAAPSPHEVVANRAPYLNPGSTPIGRALAHAPIRGQQEAGVCACPSTGPVVTAPLHSAAGEGASYLNPCLEPGCTLTRDAAPADAGSQAIGGRQLSQQDGRPKRCALSVAPIRGDNNVVSGSAACGPVALHPILKRAVWPCKCCPRQDRLPPAGTALFPFSLTCPCAVTAGLLLDCLCVQAEFPACQLVGPDGHLIPRRARLQEGQIVKLVAALQPGEAPSLFACCQAQVGKGMPTSIRKCLLHCQDGWAADDQVAFALSKLQLVVPSLHVIDPLQAMHAVACHCISWLGDLPRAGCVPW